MSMLSNEYIFKAVIKTSFPLQYFVASRHKNNDDSIESFHYDDVFRQVFGTETCQDVSLLKVIYNVLWHLHFIVKTLFVMISVTK